MTWGTKGGGKFRSSPCVNEPGCNDAICMSNSYTILITSLMWLATSAPATAESTADNAPNPAVVTLQAQSSVPENIPAAAPITCEYGCEDHREGSEICINKKQHRCNKLGWQPTGQVCAPPPPVVVK
jgi:hypothetical protein